MVMATHLHVDTNDLENGLDFILSHFDQEQLFPRKVMTKRFGYQKEVYSKKESLEYFQQSDYLDCRINAFPSFTEYKGIQRYYSDLIFIDLDKNNFKTDKSFKIALSKTLKNIKEKLNDGFPTVLETGGGYHIILPIQCPTVLENIKEFNKFDRPSEQFLRFAKNYLSNGKADKNNNPSFRSCLLRIPGSINSKNNNKVTIIQKWNGIRPNIPLEFMENFHTYLIQKKIDEYNIYRQGQQQKKKRNNHNNLKNYQTNHYYEWIEKLLKISLEDYRKLILWRILCPYLVNVKKLSYEESFRILREWLDKCNSLKKLDFNSNQKIKDDLKHVGNFYPMGIQKLKTDNEELYNFLNNNKKLEIV